MNLETHVSPDLWKEIQQNYDAARYTDAIKDAIYFLSGVIREKSNLEGDGTSLVGQAFGGQNPKIKITKLQSQSDRDTQAGVEAMLRGIYQAIRNPRSHEKFNDTKEDADAIILFINYVLCILNRSKSVFSIKDFLTHIFDPSFVRKDEYAKLLVSEIPEKFKFDTFVEIYKRKEEGDSNNLGVFLSSLLSSFNTDQIAAALIIVSDELRITSSNATVQATLSFLTPEHWKELHPAARMRIEAKILESIRVGEYVFAKRKCADGALATWARSLISDFGNKDSIVSSLVHRLTSGNVRARDYVLEYFAQLIPEIAPVPPSWIVNRLKERLRAGDVGIKDFLSGWLLNEDQNWTEPFKDDLANFKPAPEPFNSDEDVPF